LRWGGDRGFRSKREGAKEYHMGKGWNKIFYFWSKPGGNRGRKTRVPTGPKGDRVWQKKKEGPLEQNWGLRLNEKKKTKVSQKVKDKKT